jgi:hypothetical protein
MIGTEIAFRLGPGSLEDARSIADRLSGLAPAAVEHVLFCDADAGEYGCLAVWAAGSDADAYIASSQVAGEIAALTARMGTPARVRRYVMEYQRGGARPAGR